ncbi:Hha/YmoA family nucleoid-associated regulatory protein [Pantoea sp. SIMBA_133]
MNKTDWLIGFRRCRSAETLETVYEHLLYSDHTEEQYEITRAYDHPKAELATGKLYDRVPPHVWKFIE